MWRNWLNRLMMFWHQALVRSSPKPLRPAAAETAADTLSPQERELLGLLGPEPVPIDEIIRACSLNPQETAHFLFNLEMAELVRQLPGKRYELI